MVFAVFNYLYENKIKPHITTNSIFVSLFVYWSHFKNNIVIQQRYFFLRKYEFKLLYNINIMSCFEIYK